MNHKKDYNLPLKLKTLRQRAGKSQVEFAQEVHISRSCLANYEAGNRHPDNACLARIADYCHVDMDFFFDPVPAGNTICREHTLKEEESLHTKQMKSLLKNQGNCLDISSLDIEQKSKLLSYYDFIVSKYKN